MPYQPTFSLVSSKHIEHGGIDKIPCRHMHKPCKCSNALSLALSRACAFSLSTRPRATHSSSPRHSLRLKCVNQCVSSGCRDSCTVPRQRALRGRPPAPLACTGLIFRGACTPHGPMLVVRCEKVSPVHRSGGRGGKQLHRECHV